jgi:hypothetical protein
MGKRGRDDAVAWFGFRRWWGWWENVAVIMMGRSGMLPVIIMVEISIQYSNVL